LIPIKVLEEESRRLAKHRVEFGIRWDSVMDYRALEDHNRRCRELVRAARDDVVVDVPHWEESNV
jgi:hypothetical protein